MRTLLAILLITLSFIDSFAQDVHFPNTGENSEDTISIRNNFWGTHYSINGRPLNNNQLADIVRASADAKNYMDVAKGYRLVSALSGCAGGALLGYQLGNHLTGSPINLVFVYAGGALAGLGIATSISASNNTRRAARIYNNELQGRTSNVHPQLRLGFTGSGAGLALRF